MGKSTVLDLFRELGASTFDVDRFVHSTLENNHIIESIAGVLGTDDIMQKSNEYAIDKKRVADIIFNDPVKRKAVEMIIHPEVLNCMKAEITKLVKKEKTATIVIEVPLLFEAGYDIHFDRTVVVYCSRETAIRRLSAKGFSRDAALKRLAAQMAITKKKKIADYRVNNNDTLKKTKAQVERIFNDLTKRST